MDEFVLSPFISVLLAALSLTGGIFLIQDNQFWGIVLSAIGVILGYQLYASNEVVAKHKVLIAVAITLLVYSTWNTVFTARSLLVAYDILLAVLFYLTAVSIKNRDNKPSTHNFTNQDGSYLSILLMTCGTIHACILVVGYLMFPNQRWSGLFLDFGHAALFILITWGLIYPWLKNKPFGLGVTFLFFFGFFCSFSRTANLLLTVFLTGLFFVEYRNKNLATVLKLTSAMGLALLLVYLYPLIIDFDLVNRGGARDFSTLNSRTIYWQAAWESIQAHPIWGIGLGNYEYSGIKTMIPYQLVASVHNDYLQVWVELGLIWFIPFCIFVVFIILKFSPFHFSFANGLLVERRSEQKDIAWLLLLCICLYMLINFIINFLIFQLLIALIFADLANETIE